MFSDHLLSSLRNPNSNTTLPYHASISGREGKKVVQNRAEPVSVACSPYMYEMEIMITGRLAASGFVKKAELWCLQGTIALLAVGTGKHHTNL